MNSLLKKLKMKKLKLRMKMMTIWIMINKMIIQVMETMNMISKILMKRMKKN
jgi:hypothetical protein